MEFANRLVDFAVKAANNKSVINVCLVGSAVALCVRSMNQQKNIEALEAEKDSLIKSNKAMRKTIWDWKQQLFSEAESDAPLVSLTRLRAIYGDAPLASYEQRLSERNATMKMLYGSDAEAEAKTLLIVLQFKLTDLTLSKRTSYPKAYYTGDDMKKDAKSPAPTIVA